MSESSLGQSKNELGLDESAVSELIEFFMLLDKWHREAKGEVVEDGLAELGGRELS